LFPDAAFARLLELKKHLDATVFNYLSGVGISVFFVTDKSVEQPVEQPWLVIETMVTSASAQQA
jgi:hypothetical protein